ncbi:hypothetical protein [Prescottella equi]|uniref:hypothetical protein n=1 Tax=Rhodococcus hoagii TaxID=43767 RepID=UPI00158457AE|nr:hypothetical protein [Prescottella equi]
MTYRLGRVTRRLERMIKSDVARDRPAFGQRQREDLTTLIEPDDVDGKSASNLRLD